MLSEPDILRYSRQILLPEIGGRGQARLLAANVRVRGTGLMAETAVLYLAAAGVGRVDIDEHFPSATLKHARSLNPNVHFGEGDEAGHDLVCANAYESAPRALAEGARLVVALLQSIASEPQA